MIFVILKYLIIKFEVIECQNPKNGCRVGLSYKLGTLQIVNSFFKKNYISKHKQHSRLWIKNYFTICVPI